MSMPQVHGKGTIHGGYIPLISGYPDHVGQGFAMLKH